jgi:hypothetical protein
MGWIARIIGGATRQEPGGIHFDATNPYWEAHGESDFQKVFQGLIGVLPESAILYFEDGSPSGELKTLLEANTVTELAHIAPGTLWPKQALTYHLPATERILRQLSELTQGLAAPELAIHFHCYREREVLLEWHDVLSQPALLSTSLTEEAIRRFCEHAGLTPKFKTP